ncbi:MAG: 7-carboxy-7-deazaguanine synthase QueE [Pseudomonadota bacterium]
MDKLRVTEIFLSLQGESTTVGLPTVFVRLTGCPLRCVYCDTSYAFSGGQQLTLKAILAEVKMHGARHVTVTGGEPLAQRPTIELLERLCDEGYFVSLETSGALNCKTVDPRVMKVIDIKTPGSGEVERNLEVDLIASLNSGDQLKFVISDREDFDWSHDWLQANTLPPGVEVLLSPVHEHLHPRKLGEWLLEAKLEARLQIQLHKYLWGNEPGR